MSTLFLSFWGLSLSNLPTGAFTNVEISAAEAASLVSAARSGAGLFCVAANDLAAPYHHRAYDKHVQLCGELADFGIELSIDDFFAPDYCRPLQMARVGPDQDLMVVDCSYTLDFDQHIANPDDPQLQFEVAADTIKFHLLQLRDAS